MDKIVIAVGSKRKPKLSAVQNAIDTMGVLLAPGQAIEIIGEEVESGVGHTPSSREELMLGARQRAEALITLAQNSGTAWNYFVGLEGGLDVASENSTRHVFLESWAYVSNGQRGFFGRSGAVEMPEALADEVLTRGTELSVAIDAFAGGAGIRDGQGAWGILSGNLITRQEAFRVAVIAAFAPFYNSRMYAGSARAAS